MLPAVSFIFVVDLILKSPEDVALSVELDKKLIFIDQVEVANRFDLRSTIKVYDTP